MSAYGPLTRPTASPQLPPTHWLIPSKPSDSLLSTPATSLTIHHLTLPTARALPDLLDTLYAVFKAEIDGGRTYPQERVDSPAAFESYFFAADVLIALIPHGDRAVDGESGDGDVVGTSIEAARDGREWEDCLVAFYYIKPNYPGRSSHICNAGFMTVPAHRGRGYASALARSYLLYGPALGYDASVFNLVYANNAASVRLWDNLGFTRAGLVPRAGRLRTADGNGEEYVDAIVFYKRFEPVSFVAPLR